MTGNSDTNSIRGRWAKASCHVPGSGHLERSIPCQDRAGAWVSPRPCLIVLDGRGSARLSHLGAAAALFALRTAIRNWEEELSALLDAPNRDLAAIGWQGLAQMLYHVAATEQLKLAAWHETQPEKFEFTLTIAVVGRTGIGWLSVGDSPLVVSRHGVMGLATPLEEASFANQTTFVVARPQGRLGLRGGVIPSAGVDAVLAMSDGTATRLLHLSQQVPAPVVAELAKGLASGGWTESLLQDMLKEPAWDGVTRDDRSIALLALRSGTVAMPADSVEESLTEWTTSDDAMETVLPTSSERPLHSRKIPGDRAHWRTCGRIGKRICTVLLQSCKIRGVSSP